MGCSCLKATYVIFNTLFFLVAIGMALVGVWTLLSDEFKDYHEVLKAMENFRFDFWYITLLLFLSISGWLLICIVLGYAGACVENKGLYITYTIMLGMAAGAAISAGALGIVFMQDMSSKMKSELSRQVAEVVRNGTSLGDAWDGIQIEHECCGTIGYLQYRNSAFENATGLPVPESCCAMINEDNPTPRNVTVCMQEARTNNVTSALFVNHKGCYDDVNKRLSTHNAILFGVSFSIAGLLIIGMGLAIGLCGKTGHHGEWGGDVYPMEKY